MGGLKNVVNGKARYYFKRVEEIKTKKQLIYISWILNNKMILTIIAISSTVIPILCI